MWPASAVGVDNSFLSCVCCKLVFKWSEWWRILFPNYQLSSEQQQTVKQSNGINPFLSENDVIKRLGEIRRYGSCCCHLRSPGGFRGYIYIYIIYTIRRFNVIFVISILSVVCWEDSWCGLGWWRVDRIILQKLDQLSPLLSWKWRSGQLREICH